MDRKENIHPEELENVEPISDQSDSSEQQPSADKKEETSYLSLGIVFGPSLGIALGLTIFNNLGLGIGVGIVLGVAIGAALDQQNKNNK